MTITFFVPGVPVPKGSAKAFTVKSKATGKVRAIVTQDNNARQKPWASAISYAAQQAMADNPPIHGPISLGMVFIMPRIKSHFHTGKRAGEVRLDAPRWHIVKPDLDKLIRCVKDAMTNIVWNDDCQVCLYSPEPYKKYGKQPGVHIKVERL